MAGVTHSSMSLEREWVGGRTLGLVTASKPNEKKGRAADEKPMNNENQKAARVERVQQRARDDLVKKYHKELSSSSTCPTAVPGYGLCHRDCPGGLVEHLGESSCLLGKCCLH